jgi:phage terminase large subunit-like protein
LVEATGGIASRPEGFIIYLSTHSDIAPAGVFKTTLERFRRIRDGIVKDKRSLGVLYEWPEDLLRSEAYLDPKLFYVTNPNLGASVDEEYLVEKLAEETDKGPEAKQAWVAKHLNVQVDVALNHGRWAGADEWEAAADHTLTLESLIARSEVAVIGVDGGGLDDLLAAAVIGRDRETQQWLLWVHCWANEKVLERRKDIADRLRDFAFCGDLTICREPNEDVEGFAAFVKRAVDAGLLPDERAIGFDAKGVAELVGRVEKIGVTENQMVAVKQGVALNPEIEGMPRKLVDGTMVHGGQPIMDWMVGNAKAVARGSSLTIEKQTSGKAKIDGLMAAFNAFHLMTMNPAAPSGGLVDDYFAAIRAASNREARV